MAEEIVRCMIGKKICLVTGDGLTQTVQDLGMWNSGKHSPCMCCLEFSPQHLENKTKIIKINRLRKIHRKMHRQKMRIENG